MGLLLFLLLPALSDLTDCRLRPARLARGPAGGSGRGLVWRWCSGVTPPPPPGCPLCSMVCSPPLPSRVYDRKLASPVLTNSAHLHQRQFSPLSAITYRTPTSHQHKSRPMLLLHPTGSFSQIEPHKFIPLCFSVLACVGLLEPLTPTAWSQTSLVREERETRKLCYKICNSKLQWEQGGEWKLQL